MFLKNEILDRKSSYVTAASEFNVDDIVLQNRQLFAYMEIK